MCTVQFASEKLTALERSGSFAVISFSFCSWAYKLKRTRVVTNLDYCYYVTRKRGRAQRVARPGMRKRDCAQTGYAIMPPSE